MPVNSLLGLGGLGAALHVAGSVLIVFGQASVKVAHSIIDSTGAPSTWVVPRNHPHPPLWRRPDGKWRRQKAGSKAYAVGGWAAFAVGNLLRFVAMRFAAQTVLSGLGSLQFVIIPIASRFMLGIRASAPTAMGVGVVLLGNALIILYGPAEVTFTLAQLRAQWATPAMTTFLVVLGGLLCLLQWMHWRLGAAARAAAGLQPSLAAAMEGGGGKPAVELDAGGGRALLPAGSGKWVGGVGGGMPIPLAPAGSLGPLGLGPLLPRDHDTVTVFAGALLFSAVASFVGAWSVLFSKSLTYVVSYMPGSLADWYSWFVLAAFLGTAAFWVRQSDRGLRHYPASLIMPLMQAFWMCMSVLEGGIYFDELLGLPSPHLALLVLGLVLALLGAIFMGIAGYVAEKPEHIFHYSAASSELAAADGDLLGPPGALSPPPQRSAAAATVQVLVEKLHAATGRVDRLSEPVLRASSQKNGFTIGSGTASDEAELGKPGWWQQQQQQQHEGGSARVHLVATPLRGELDGGNLELLPRGVAAPRGGSATPPGAASPGTAEERRQAVCSPTQQLLSREGSGQGSGQHTRLSSAVAFERALEASGAGSGGNTAGGSPPFHQDSILLDEINRRRQDLLQRRDTPRQ